MASLSYAMCQSAAVFALSILREFAYSGLSFEAEIQLFSRFSVGGHAS